MLTARPLLASFFPELTGIDQPLGGLVAARRELLLRLGFETDYGADVGLLLDAFAAGARIDQVHVGRIVHDSQPLAALADMASQVVRVVMDRAGRLGRLRLSHLREVAEVERHASDELGRAERLRGGDVRLVVLPIDGVLVEGGFFRALARRTRRLGAYEAAARARGRAPEDRIALAAEVFRGVRKRTFLDEARRVPLVPGARRAVRELRRAGFRVGVVSAGSRLVAEIVRRRVFADLSTGNLLRFRGERASGEITFPPSMAHEGGCRLHPRCTSNVVRHLAARLGVASRDLVAVGRDPEHACLLRVAGCGVALGGADATCLEAADVVADDLDGVLAVADRL